MTHYKQVDRNRACCFVRDPSFLTRTKTSLILSSRLNSGSTFAGGARIGFRSIFRPCLNPQDDDGLLLLLLPPPLIYSLTRMLPQSNCISSATAEHNFDHSAATAPASLLCSFFFFFSRDQRHKRHGQGGMHRVPISNLFNVVFPALPLYPMDPALLRFL